MEIQHTTQSLFQERLIPKETSLAGFSALVEAFDIQAPVRKPSAVSIHHVRGSIRAEEDWQIYDKRYRPENTLASHLTFALKHENLDLLVLKRLFEKIPQKVLETFIQSAPMGTYTRRVWFLYEFLMDKQLDIPDAPNVGVVDLLDPKQYFTTLGQVSKRHRVRNNLLGVSQFCPLIRRTKVLETFVDLNLSSTAKETVGRVSHQLVTRAASFLLLADSRASFEIEGQCPSRNRLERWTHAIRKVGKYPLNLDEIIRLHQVLLGDERFVQVGLRQEGVFLGERDHFREPLPEFIGARPEDLGTLINGLIKTNDLLLDSGVDPVLQAAAIAFGFVYIHPLQDGNGRLHRCLIHHVLAERRFTPPGMVFPVSSVMLNRIDDYRKTLQEHSGPLMEYIDWCSTPEGNVTVLNDTADLYRYYDCTEEAEFLYHCVKRTVEEDLPMEIDYLRRHDEAMRRIMNTVEMPDRLAEDFILFTRQNNGHLPISRRKKPFEGLTDKEVSDLETIVREAFEGFTDKAPV